MIPDKATKIAGLQMLTLEPGFWDDRSKAQQVMAEISKHEEELQMVTHWKGIIDDVCVALELHAEGDTVCSPLPGSCMTLL